MGRREGIGGREGRKRGDRGEIKHSFWGGDGKEDGRGFSFFFTE